MTPATEEIASLAANGSAGPSARRKTIWRLSISPIEIAAAWAAEAAEDWQPIGENFTAVDESEYSGIDRQ
jgi:hypothetical protein